MLSEWEKNRSLRKYWLVSLEDKQKLEDQRLDRVKKDEGCLGVHN